MGELLDKLLFERLHGHFPSDFDSIVNKYINITKSECSAGAVDVIEMVLILPTRLFSILFFAVEIHVFLIEWLERWRKMRDCAWLSVTLHDVTCQLSRSTIVETDVLWGNL